MSEFWVLRVVNLAFCWFIGLGFVYSDSRLFGWIGVGFLIWSALFSVWGCRNG